MIVKMFSDYMAYTFEMKDTLFMIGMRLVDKSQSDIISPVDVTHNGRVRLLYGTEGYKLLSEVVGVLDNSELVLALVKFIKSIRNIQESDFLKITAIDINFNRLFYDPKEKSIQFVLLPINYECDLHDGESWSAVFRKTILILMSYIFAVIPEKYNEMYYAIMDDAKTDDDVIDYISNYEFELQNVENIQVVPGESEISSKRLVLEHRGIDGNYIYVINKPEFVLGKSANVDGSISNSTNVSRKHCKITQVGCNYMIEDLGSTNGTILNGYILNSHEGYYINNGDKLVLADVELTAILE